MSVPEDADALATLAWVGDAASGFLRLIDQTRLPTEFDLLDCRDVPAVWEAITVAAGSRRAGDRGRRGLWRGDRGPVAGSGRRSDRAAGAARGTGSPPHQPADRRQPVLGARPHGSRLPARAIAGRRRSSAARNAARRGPGDRSRKTGDVPRDRPERRALWSRPARAS